MAEFEDVDSVIGNPYAFKNKLGIGEDAFESLRMKKNLGKMLRAADTVGAAGVGMLVAKSSLVAGAMFPATGLLGFLGLASAATPIGWVIAAGAASSLAYYGISRYFASGKDDKIDVIPKWINTPMDVLAVGLFDFLAPLGLKVAFSDRIITEAERTCIHDYFVEEWGYSEEFVRDALIDVEKNIESFSIAELTNNLIKYKKENPDCNYEIMAEELKEFLERVLHSNGEIDDQGEIIVTWIEERLNQAKPTLVQNAATQVRDFWSSAFRRSRKNK